jgi:hypothetical protein
MWRGIFCLHSTFFEEVNTAMVAHGNGHEARMGRTRHEAPGQAGPSRLAGRTLGREHYPFVNKWWRYRIVVCCGRLCLEANPAWGRGAIPWTIILFNYVVLSSKPYLFIWFKNFTEKLISIQCDDQFSLFNVHWYAVKPRPKGSFSQGNIVV